MKKIKQETLTEPFATRELQELSDNKHKYLNLANATSKISTALRLALGIGATVFVLSLSGAVMEAKAATVEPNTTAQEQVELKEPDLTPYYISMAASGAFTLVCLGAYVYTTAKQDDYERAYNATSKEFQTLYERAKSDYTCYEINA